MPARQPVISRQPISPIERVFPGRRILPLPLGSPGGQVPPALVELNLGGSWIDVSGYVRYSEGITITRGRTDEGREVERGTCKLTVDNTDGRFSPRNPTGAYYGLLGRNTPLRVAVPYQGGLAYRFTGELSSLPVRWDLSGTDVYVQIEASGILRRLGQGATPLKSAPRRFVEANNPASYRHLEDGPLTPFSSSAAKVNFRYGVGDLAVWLPPSLQIIGIGGVNTGITLAGITTVDTSQWSVDYMFQSDTDKPWGSRYFVGGGETGYSFLARFRPATSEIEIYYTPDNTGVDASLSLTSTTTPFDNKPHHVRFRAVQNGGNVDVTVYIDGVSTATATKTSVTNAGVRTFWLFPYSGTDGSFFNLGHVAAWTANAPSVTDAANAALGHQGEKAGRRIERLCSEEGLEFTPVGNLDQTHPMGPQFTDTLVDILREAANTDLGILFEPRQHLGFGYRTRSSLYNQTPRLALTYTASELASPPEPVDDDQNTRNDITVTRREGESFSKRLETGTLSVLDPPVGVGRYDENVTVNPPSDVYLPNQAAWRLHLGTVDEARYPSVDLHLQRQQITADLRLNIVDTDIGDRVTIDDPPAWLPPDQISTIMQGSAERLDQFEHQIMFNTAPESPYQVGVYGAAATQGYRYDTAGSSLATAFAAGADTSMSVAVDTLPLWVTAAGEFPLEIECGGVRLEVTAISGSSSPQTFTITATPVNGVTKTIPAGTPVSLWTKAVYAL